MTTRSEAGGAEKPVVLLRGKATWWFGFGLLLLVLGGVVVGARRGMQRFDGYEGVILAIEGDVVDWIAEGPATHAVVKLQLDDGRTIRRSVEKDFLLQEGITGGTRIRKERGFFSAPRRVTGAP